ncbi:MlaD family protein [Nocardia sp. CDC160]|uniref:MlaD family protein n=1 Tax=Nocardia sp. CDC160 TaxID=3112166 RepID=UPI002DB89652|nr:hypothetical protein [Nocardia sp. CDC160]MEC3919390.1 hypothetical protein [Nocardia sp. CDC160]
MPAYGMPGVPTSRRGALVVGAVVIVALIVVAFVWRGVATRRDGSEMRIQLHTSAIGDGVVPGAGVRLNGVQVGKITKVDSVPGGTQLLTLALNRSQLFGLGDDFRVDYAPANLFGISELILRRGPGGTPLHDGSTVDLTAAGRVTDSTMGNLLRSLAATSQNVLTPQLTDALNRTSTDIEAFAPLIEAMVGVSRAVADTQQYPSSFLIQQYGSFFNGVAVFGHGFVKLVNEIYHIDVLRNDRAHFDTGVSLVVDDLFPKISALGRTAEEYLNGYTDGLSVLLGQLARMVPDSARTQADLRDLLDRLDRTFQSTPDGPRVGLDVVVKGMPGLAVPLLGGATPTGEGSR